MRAAVCLCAATLCQAAEAAELPGQAVVAKLLAAVDQQDRSAFEAVAAPDALIAANDVGGPLTMDALPFNKLNCQLVGYKPGKALPPPDDQKYDFVDARWNCPNADRSGLHSVTVSFVIRGEQVKAALMGMNDQ